MTEFKQSNTAKYLTSIYSVSTPTECASIYDSWSESYDVDVVQGNVEYVAPRATALRAKTEGGNMTGSILDAGCGTGLVGVALAQYGAKNIDGIDLSSGMLNEARKTGVYRDLSIVDMSKQIDKPDESYDVITCCGTFTPGHVGPDPGIKELVRLAKKGGVIVATITDVIFDTGGYRAEIERLASDGLITIVATAKEPYRVGSNTLAHMVVLRRSDLAIGH
ncbi:Methyltransferase-like protein 27 [Metarhizium anisopliae]|uniref:Methyltransferase type 11 n=2 Tax=Metarhizium robertsii TaxID=568076 RepID=E9FD81_METRA|nr:Methyltransferase type 11 [Metarhizium robertsii ARSEF 23]EFY94325.1 Methyltransferase type 11 [Metarhizium robertsii ARSEF 23]EXU98650.1 S-adenosylmethionine-dependent methyltransferase family protein [Metarhizium robertsii]KAF5139493.1 Methyltransferase-like protein 27 [Metarhizium anisopliae]